ncbi:MAG: PEP-CTERM sorting domain-containing protein [Phycisphaerae bacterium]|nr:PEP-CTERM sorting domain-containing protein [Phycisphaerae bacterium]
MKRQILFAFLVLSILCGSAFAGRTWFYNEITDSYGMPITNVDSAIGMRSGNAWPVVAYSSGGNSGVAVMLPGAWAAGPASFTGEFLDGAVAPDGTMGFVDNSGRVITLNTAGWGSSYCGSIYPSMSRNSIAFNNNSAPGVVYRSSSDELTLAMRSGGSWYNSTIQGYPGGPGIMTDAFALDFDSYNQANVAFKDGDTLRYATKGVLTGNQWSVSSFMDAPFIGNAAGLDMALTNEDVPYVFYNNNNFLSYAVYDRQSDSWMTNILDTLVGMPMNFCVKADSTGGIGVAYVADFGGIPMLSFAYVDGSGWMGVDRLVEARGEWMIGLAFDYENNPVISFVDDMGNLTIAYDPIPEPATMAIFALGLAFIRRR